MNILSSFADCPLTREVIVSKDETVTVGSINEELVVRGELLSKLYGNNVALNFESEVTLAKWLLFLDGRVNRIIIIPSDLTPLQLQKYLSQSETSQLISDRSLSYDCIETFNVNTATVDSTSTQIKTELIASEWVIFTSGTTGSPKLVKHSLQSLTSSMQRSKASFEPSWGMVYSLYRFAGLQVFLQCMLSMNKVVFGSASQSLKETLMLFEENNVNCISATPTLWRKILMQPASNNLHLKSITLGGEIADQNIIDALCAKFRTAKIRHIYASTEAGAGFSVNDGLAGFPSSLIGSLESDVNLKISANNTLMIKSASMSSGYIGNDSIEFQDGFIDTGDVVSCANGRYYFEGRENGAINVGGNKVQPELVESTILRHSHVLMVSVSAKKSPIMGSLVQAHVVIDDCVVEPKQLVKDIKAHCRKHLESFMVPAFIKIVDDLELNATGKIIRNG